MSQQARVFIIVLIRVRCPVDEVIEALEPDKAGHLITGLLVVFRTDPLGIRQNLPHVLHHHPVKYTRGGVLFILPFLPLFKLGNPVSSLGVLVPHILNLLGQFVLPGTGRTELGVERPAAPGSLDNQNGLLQLFLHEDSEGELRPDLLA